MVHRESHRLLKCFCAIFTLLLGFTWFMVEPPPTGSAQAIDEGLVVWLPLDEGTGSSVGDASGNGNNGVLLGGGDWVAGESGSAVDLINPVDGNNFPDWIEIPADVSQNLDRTVTLAAWVNPFAFRNGAGIITKGENITSYAMRIRGNGRLMFTANFGEPFGWQGAGDWSSSSRLEEGIWQHAAITYDGSQLRFYINGIEDDSSPSLDLQFGRATQPLFIGADFPADDQFFNGAVDDVRVYNRALSSSEIRELAGEPTPTPTNTSTNTPEPTPTFTPTHTPTPTPTPTHTNTPVPTNSPTAVPSSTPAPTATPVPTSTTVPTSTPVPTSTTVPTSEPSPTAEPGATVTPTMLPTEEATQTAEPSPTIEPPLGQVEDLTAEQTFYVYQDQQLDGEISSGDILLFQTTITNTSASPVTYVTVTQNENVELAFVKDSIWVVENAIGSGEPQVDQAFPYVIAKINAGQSISIVYQMEVRLRLIDPDTLLENQVSITIADQEPAIDVVVKVPVRRGPSGQDGSGFNQVFLPTIISAQSATVVE